MTVCAIANPAQEETFTILGAWDGDPERHIISYQTAIGQALLGQKIGEVVTLNTDTDGDFQGEKDRVGASGCRAGDGDQGEPVAAG